MVSKKQYINLIYPFVLALLGILYTSTYVVPEGQRALAFYADQPIKSASNTPVIKSPGLNFRIPFFTRARLYDHRLQHLNIRSDQITTHDLSNIQMEVSVRYYILNPVLYFNWVDKMDIQANSIEVYLSSKLNQYLKSTFALHTEKAVISDDVRHIYPKQTGFQAGHAAGKVVREPGNRSVLSVPEDDRSTYNASENLITKGIQAFLREISLPLGIEITDTYLTQLRLSEATRERFFEHMKKSYEQLSAEYRTQGEITAAKIRGQALNQARELIHTAQEQAANIRTKSDAFAIELYNQAYRKHPKFAQVYQNLVAYQRSLDSSSPTLILFQLGKLLNSNTLTI